MKTTSFLLLVMLCSFSPLSAQLGNLVKDARQLSNSGRQAAQTAPPATRSTPAPTGQEQSTPSPAGQTYYVCAATGRGQLATREQPARDLSVVVPKLQPGDVVYLSGGVYTGRMDEGSDLIEVPVSIIGGWNDSFTARDPWGAHKTVLTGNNVYMKSSLERLAILTDRAYKDWDGEIVIDGIIVDNGPRNRYHLNQNLAILRKADPAGGQNPSPNTPGIKVRTGQRTRVAVRNCVVMNTAPTQGAIDLQLNKGGSAIVENNLVINNTGEGIMCKTNWHSPDAPPRFLLRNNTILFSWKYDPIGSFGGNAIMMDGNTVMTIEHNLLGFGDFGGVNNVKQCKALTLANNVFFGHKAYDYKEYNTKMGLADTEDYAQYLTPQSGGNTTATPLLPIPKSWSEIYLSRRDISREEVDASVTVSNSGENQVRGILGLPLQGNAVKTDAEIFLPLLPLADLNLPAFQRHNGAGCQNPGLTTR